MKYIALIIFLVFSIQGQSQKQSIPEKYNWFPSDYETMQTYFKKGFPFDIRGWHVTGKTIMTGDGDIQLTMIDLTFQNTRKNNKYNSCLNVYYYQMGISSVDGKFNIDIHRTPEETKRIDSILKKII